MTIKFSITKNDVELTKDKYKWDENARIFETDENHIKINFQGVDNVSFNTGDRCEFKTGDNCVFRTGKNCIFKTGQNCRFDTLNFCKFDTLSHCEFRVGTNCSFRTSHNCKFVTKYDCEFETTDGCRFKTGDGCIFKTGYECNFKTGVQCVLSYTHDHKIIKFNIPARKSIRILRSGVISVPTPTKNTILGSSDEQQVSKERLNMLPPFILYPSYHDDVKKYISKFPKQIDWVFSIPSSTDKEYFSIAMLEELFSPGKSQHKFYHHSEDNLHLIGVEIYSTDYVVVKYTFIIWLLKTLKLIRI